MYIMRNSVNLLFHYNCCCRQFIATCLGIQLSLPDIAVGKMVGKPFKRNTAGDHSGFSL
jgi:hypothetical protein